MRPDLPTALSTESVDSSRLKVSGRESPALEDASLEATAPSARAALAGALDRLLRFELSWPRRLLSLCVFLATTSLALYGLTYLHWPARGLYWIDHVLFGLGFPFRIYAVFGSWRLGLFFTLGWSLGNELWEDQLTRAVYSIDWDHLVADFVGAGIATATHARLRRCFPSKAFTGSAALRA
jgi:hypothetical protein